MRKILQALDSQARACHLSDGHATSRARAAEPSRRPRHTRAQGGGRPGSKVFAVKKTAAMTARLPEEEKSQMDSEERSECRPQHKQRSPNEENTLPCVHAKS